MECQKKLHVFYSTIYIIRTCKLDEVFQCS